MRALLLAMLLLAPFADSVPAVALGSCDAPGSTCSAAQRCVASGAVCEEDSGGACPGASSGYHATRVVGGVSMQSSCCGGAQSRRVDAPGASWSDASSGSSQTTVVSVGAAGFVWRGSSDGCSMGAAGVQRACVASLAPPAPPVPGSQLLP